MKAIRHFITITHHKILVMQGCFRIGLYKQGLLHDMSKYSPTEFLVGCRYYKGYMSRIMRREPTGAIHLRGFIIRDAISITWSTGLTMLFQSRGTIKHIQKWRA